MANEIENYNLAFKLREELNALTSKLKEALGINFSQTVEMILSKFSVLYQRQSDLRKQTEEKKNNPEIDAKLAEFQEQLEKGIKEIKVSIEKKEPVQITYEKLNVINSIISKGQVSIEGKFNPMLIGGEVEIEELICSQLFREE
jgi:hypothetical protein